MTPSRRVLLREWAALTLLLGVFLLAADRGNWLERADLWLYDFVVSRPALPPAAGPVIIAIDEPSLAMFGRWPWSRRVLARAVDQLREAGSGPLLLDIILAEPQRDDPGADELLAAALARHGRVVLPVFMPAGSDREPVQPLSAFVAVAGLGHAQALLDRDGVARRVMPLERSSSGSFRHIAWSLVDSFAALDASPRLIRFRGPKGSFPTYSMAMLLAGKIPPEALRGRTILVGATASGLGDALVTPLAGRDGALSGVEFVANVVDSLNDGAMPQNLPAGISRVLALGLLLLLMAVFVVAPPRAALAASLGLAAASALGAGLVLHFFNYWWPPAACAVAAVLAYPLWSWRRLEASIGVMERETRRIASMTPAAPARMNPVSLLSDVVERRIEAITGAVDRVADALALEGDPAEARRNRDEMLRHLAHDLRAPLISLRGLADELRAGRGGDTSDESLNRIDRCAQRALELVEQFILLGRVEALAMDTRADVDLVALLHQAADDLWDDARRQGGRVERRCNLDGAWVRGDARLLHRALLNLGWNALRYGPQQGVVTLVLEAREDGYRLSVHDEGTGFSVSHLEALTSAYSQGPGAATLRGHGLGLALVRKVAEKHGATLSVEHPPAGGFTVILDFVAAPATSAA